MIPIQITELSTTVSHHWWGQFSSNKKQRFVLIRFLLSYKLIYSSSMFSTALETQPYITNILSQQPLIWIAHNQYDNAQIFLPLPCVHQFTQRKCEKHLVQAGRRKSFVSCVENMIGSLIQITQDVFQLQIPVIFRQYVRTNTITVNSANLYLSRNTNCKKQYSLFDPGLGTQSLLYHVYRPSMLIFYLHPSFS